MPQIQPRLLHNSLALTLLLTLGVIWSLGFIIAHFATTHGINSLGYIFWEVIGPLFLISLLALVSKNKLNFSSKNLQCYLFCGLFGIALPDSATYFAAPHLPAGLLGVIVSSSPFWIYCLALSFKMEKFFWGRLLGVSLGLVGIFFIIFHKAALGGATTLPWGILAVTAPLGYSITAVYIAKQAPKQDGLTLLCGMLFVSAILLSPIVFTTHSFYQIHRTPNLADYLLLTEIVLSSLGYIILFKLLRLMGPVYYSMVDGVVVIMSLFFGYLFFTEKLNLWTSLGVLLILSAIFLVNFWHKHSVMQITEPGDKPLKKIKI